MSLYHKIWADCLNRAKAQPDNENNWLSISFVIVTITMAVNISFIVIVVEKFILKTHFYEVDLHFLPWFIDKLGNFIILFVMPPAIVNYLMVLRGRRYEKLMKRYQNENRHTFLIYLIISIIALLSIIVLL